MDLNHDKQIQSLLCYRYTIGQTSAFKLDAQPEESRFVKSLNRCSVKSVAPVHRFDGSAVQRN